MWYVIQTISGKEDDIRKECETYIDPTVLERCVIFLYEEKKRYQGEWHTEQKKLFPGYIILQSDHLPELYEELKKIPNLTKLLGTGREIVPLTEEEIQFLKQFAGEDELVQMSEGILNGSQVEITAGPLKGKEALIQKIDRHKRKAWLEMELFGRRQRVEVGLEIIKKIEKEM